MPSRRNAARQPQDLASAPTIRPASMRRTFSPLRLSAPGTVADLRLDESCPLTLTGLQRNVPVLRRCLDSSNSSISECRQRPRRRLLPHHLVSAGASRCLPNAWPLSSERRSRSPRTRTASSSRARGRQTVETLGRRPPRKTEVEAEQQVSGWEAGIRTPITASRAPCPTVERPPSGRPRRSSRREPPMISAEPRRSQVDRG